MLNIEMGYLNHKLWRDGTRQEIIADPGEGLEEAISFMRSNLEFYGHRDLTFKVNEIIQEGNNFYITLRSKNTKIKSVFKKQVVDEVFG